ncbi:hypothetical protein CEXT_343291 [Caerostris extrusa]|uniref:Uncharacterized protein n=1 Tax=Caerostris extrusa TaxID=172846 RepID=A0AAV4VH78_CAEEX|nr:hypothetical protein CEXT_343291 [Caerostris extrusa]
MGENDSLPSTISLRVNFPPPLQDLRLSPGREGQEQSEDRHEKPLPDRKKGAAASVTCLETLPTGRAGKEYSSLRQHKMKSPTRIERRVHQITSTSSWRAGSKEVSTEKGLFEGEGRSYFSLFLARKLIEKKKQQGRGYKGIWGQCDADFN